MIGSADGRPGVTAGDTIRRRFDFFLGGGVITSSAFLEVEEVLGVARCLNGNIDGVKDSSPSVYDLRPKRRG